MNCPKRYSMRIRVFNEQPGFGNGVAELLTLIDQEASLSAAYKKMGMSSSKAWKILKRAEEDLNISLVEGSAGGARGGSSHLTKEGKEFLERYQKFYQAIDRAARQAFEEYFTEP